jgi:UDP-glucose 4-epimerase
MNKKKTKIIITGGSGFIGSCLASFLSEKYQITSIDKKKKSQFSDKNLSHIKVDLKNKAKLDRIINAIKPDHIIHLAGQSTIDMVVVKKKSYYEDNFLATKNLISAIEKFKVPNLIFASTASVYKEKNRKIDENSKIYSNNSYGSSKIKCENIIKQINPKFTKYCILRFFNVSSSLVKKKIGEYHTPETHLIPLTVNSILKKKQIYIYGKNYKTEDGTCYRDYIHILDILNGIKKSIKYLSKTGNKSNIFNLGSGRSYSVLQIINYLLKITKSNIKPLIKKKRKFDVGYLQCDIKKAKKILNWKPKFSNLKDIICDEIWWQQYLNKKKLIRKFIY